MPLGLLEWVANHPRYDTIDRNVGDGCMSFGRGATFQATNRPLVMARGFFNWGQARINVYKLQVVTLAIQSFFCD